MPMTTGETQRLAATEDRSIRPVIEHALTDYGYSPDTARTLIDRLIAEGRGE
ncbi:hypothetical protein [Streptomyces sp. ME18-1-4]|uniref:hypothetical protein n=1 Tax=Streptomyces sp. ME18-1-4 TaxID=3028685 RepID=UPI0029BC0444|nr:hypothetical protein [Streptomyces sp. ME18-1-4]MDX3249008.1 hypothetical protein [Streptomyces sp. ME18-1-4]